MITSYEVEFEHKIGSGGLCVSFWCTIDTRFSCTLCQWPSLQRKLEQDESSAQGAGDGPWRSTQLHGTLNILVYIDSFDIYFRFCSQSIMRSR